MGYNIIRKKIENLNVVEIEEKLSDVLNNKVTDMDQAELKKWLIAVDELDALIREIKNLMGIYRLGNLDPSLIDFKKFKSIIFTYNTNIYKIAQKINLAPIEEFYWLANTHKKKQRTLDKANEERILNEKHLKETYQQILYSRKSEFNSSKLSIKELDNFLLSSERNTRKDAWLKQREILLNKSQELNSIYSKMIINRNVQAENAGFKDYFDLLSFKKDKFTSKQLIDKISYFFIEYLLPIKKQINLIKIEKYKLKFLKPWDQNIAAAVNSTYTLSEGNIKNHSKNAMKFFLNNEKNIPNYYSRFVHFKNKNQTYSSFCSPLPYCGEVVLSYPFKRSYNNLIQFAHELGHATHYSIMLNHCKFKYQTLISQELLEFPSLLMELCFIYSLDFSDSSGMYNLKLQHTEQMLKIISNGLIYYYFQEYNFNDPSLTLNERNKLFIELLDKYEIIPDLPSYKKEIQIEWLLANQVFLFPYYSNDYLVGQIYALISFVKSLANPGEYREQLFNVLKKGSQINLKQAANHLDLRLNLKHFKLVNEYLTNRIH